MSKYIGSQPTLAPVAVPYRYRKFKDVVGRKTFDLQHDPNFVEVRLDGHPLIRGEDFTSVNSNNTIKLDTSINITNAESILEVFAYGNIQLASQFTLDETLTRAKLAGRTPALDLVGKRYFTALVGENINFVRNSIAKAIDIDINTNQYQAKNAYTFDCPAVAYNGFQIHGQVENLFQLLSYTDLTQLKAAYSVNPAAFSITTGSSAKGLTVDDPVAYNHLTSSITNSLYGIVSSDYITDFTENELVTISFYYRRGTGDAPIAFQFMYYDAARSANRVAMNIAIEMSNDTIASVQRGTAGTPTFDPNLDLTSPILKVEKIGSSGWKRYSLTAKIGKVTTGGVRCLINSSVTAASVTAGCWFHFDAVQITRSGYPKAMLTDAQIKSPDILYSASPLDLKHGFSFACKVSIPAVGRLGYNTTTSNFTDNRRFLFSGVVAGSTDRVWAYLEPATSHNTTTGQVNLVVKVGNIADVNSEFRYPINIGTDAELDIMFTRKGTTGTLIVNGNMDIRSNLQEMSTILTKLMIGCTGTDEYDAYAFLNGSISHIRVWNSGV